METIQTKSAVSSSCSSHCCGSNVAKGSAATQQEPAEATSGAAHGEIFVSAMDCASEEAEIRRELSKLGGVKYLTFDLGRRIVSVDADEPTISAAVLAIEKLGFGPKRVPAQGSDAQATSAAAELGKAEPRRQMMRLGFALALALGAETLSFFAPEAWGWEAAKMGLAALAIWLAGFGTYRKGLAALRAGRLNINALMTVAITGAFLIGQWAEAAMVMALYAFAELIEARAVERARNAIKGLMSLAPESAEVRLPSAGWSRLVTSEIAVGTVFRVRPGERVPLDGVIAVGCGTVDQSSVTGESIPVDKEPGDEVFAGTINLSSEIEVRSSALATGTLLARIIKAVEEAQGSKAPTQRFVDRFAAVYTPAVFAVALAVAIGGPLLFDLGWVASIYKALVLLVIACPCAFVISTPVTIVSGLAAAARLGVLIKGGAYLEGARKLRAVALDKTGTITEGKPRLMAFEAIDPAASAGMVESWAKGMAERSDHPVSKAVAAGLAAAAVDVADFAASPGRGVSATVDGQQLMLGNARWAQELGLQSQELTARMSAHERMGRSVTLLMSRTSVLALMAVADTIKPSSRAAVEHLKRLGVLTVMLTGDNRQTAVAVASAAGIEEVRGPLLPDEKLAAIKEIQARNGATAMAGDGINDAPALAQADIGFAMGGAGTHVAMEAADIVVMNDDLSRVAQTVELSKRTHAVLVQNITLALGIKAVFLGLAVSGQASMWMAVFADVGASLLVIFNGLRLVRPSVPSAGSPGLLRRPVETSAAIPKGSR